MNAQRAMPHLAHSLGAIGLMLVLLGAAAVLTGCGGGDPEDSPADQPPPVLDCKARPEVCK